DRRPLARVQQLARADREHPAPLRLLLGRVRQHDPAGRLLLGLDLLDDHAILEGSNRQLSHVSVSFYRKSAMSCPGRTVVSGHPIPSRAAHIIPMSPMPPMPPMPPPW